MLYCLNSHLQQNTGNISLSLTMIYSTMITALLVPSQCPHSPAACSLMLSSQWISSGEALRFEYFHNFCIFCWKPSSHIHDISKSVTIRECLVASIAWWAEWYRKFLGSALILPSESTWHLSIKVTNVKWGLMKQISVRWPCLYIKSNQKNEGYHNREVFSHHHRKWGDGKMHHRQAEKGLFELWTSLGLSFSLINYYIGNYKTIKNLG